MNVVTIAYLAVLREVEGIAGGTRRGSRGARPGLEDPRRQARARVRPRRILRDAVERVRTDLGLTGIATAFVGPTFTLAELRAVYEELWGIELDAANFRRSMLAEEGWVVPTGRRRPPPEPRAASRRSSTERAACGGTARRSEGGGTSESGEIRPVRAARGPARGRDRSARAEGGRGARPRPRDDGRPERLGPPPHGVLHRPLLRRLLPAAGRPHGARVRGRGGVGRRRRHRVRPGDRVFGIGAGTNAEYVCVRAAGAIARIPDALSFEEAAAVADGGLSAVSLLKAARLEQGRSDRGLRRFGVDRHGCRAGGEAPRCARHRRCEREGRGRHAVDRSRRGGRVRAGGLREAGQDVRRHPRRGRQDVLPPLPACARARRDLRHDRSRVHVARRGRLADDEAGEARDRALHEGGSADPRGADRGGGVSAR